LNKLNKTDKSRMWLDELGVRASVMDASVDASD
jgi:hypothetical protein